MRIALLLFAALPALAQAPADFRASAPVTLGGTDALHQLELPFEVYRDARGDLADIRVFNAAREPVPMAWAGSPETVLDTAATVDLPIFPVSKLERTQGKGGDEVTVHTASGTLVAVRGKTSATTVARPAAYLVDSSKTTEPIRALVFDWKATPGNEVVTIRLDSSEDLKSWSALAAAPVVRLESEGRSLVQPRMEFVARTVKYFRVHWDTPGFVFNGVRAEFEPRGKAPPRQVRTATATAGKDGELVYDLGARLPVEAFRLLPSQNNAVLSATIHVRDDPDGPWRLVSSAAFYRLQRDGKEVMSPPIEIGRRAARYWMARLAAGSSGGTPPTLEVEWRAARLVFVTQGEAPFDLAFGNAQATPTALSVSTLVPGYERGAELRLPQARVGEVRAGPPPSRFEGIVGDIKPRRVALWAILVGGVAALAFMAWRLSRQMK